MIAVSSTSTALVPNPNANGQLVPNTVPSTLVNSNMDEDTQKGITGGPCTLALANGLSSSREYAYIDCSEVYLSGKRVSGVYEIW